MKYTYEVLKVNSKGDRADIKVTVTEGIEAEFNFTGVLVDSKENLDKFTETIKKEVTAIENGEKANENGEKAKQIKIDTVKASIDKEVIPALTALEASKK